MKGLKVKTQKELLDLRQVVLDGKERTYRSVQDMTVDFYTTEHAIARMHDDNLDLAAIDREVARRKEEGTWLELDK